MTSSLKIPTTVLFTADEACWSETLYQEFHVMYSFTSSLWLCLLDLAQNHVAPKQKFLASRLRNKLQYSFKEAGWEAEA